MIERKFYMFRFGILLPLFVALVLSGCFEKERGSLPVPNGSREMAATMEQDGTIHITYHYKEKAYYVSSKDGGKTLSKPILITEIRSVYATRLSIEVGTSGNVYVAYWDEKFKFQRMEAGSTGFEKPIEEVGDRLAVDIDENIFITRLGNLDKRPVTDDDPIPTNVWINASYDKGKTFLKKPVRVDLNAPGSACDCCKPNIMVDNKGKIYIAYRSAANNERNIYLITFDKETLLNGPHRVIRIGEENWVLFGCPASSPSIEGKDGKVVISWMSGEKGIMPDDRINLKGLGWSGGIGGNTTIFYAVSDDSGNSFKKQHELISSDKTSQNFPSLGMSNDFFLLGWKNGDEVDWVKLSAAGEIVSRKTGEKPKLGSYEELISLAHPSFDKTYMIWSNEDRKTYSIKEING